jgi:hypothetical protein
LTNNFVDATFTTTLRALLNLGIHSRLQLTPSQCQRGAFLFHSKTP